MKKIPLSQGKYALLDDEDYDRLIKYKWCFTHGYARRNVKRGLAGFYMHWDIIGKPKEGFVVDHVNRDPLDNRKNNLRICTQRQNCYNGKIAKNNTSGITGVSWRKKVKKWIAQITVNRKNINLGTFNSKKEASLAYRNALKKYR